MHAIVIWILLILIRLHRKHLLPMTVLSTLLFLFSSLFSLLAHTSPRIDAISRVFPSSMTKLHKYLQFTKDEFVKFVVCPNSKCFAVYDYNDCVVGSGKYANIAQICYNSEKVLVTPCCYALLKLMVEESYCIRLKYIAISL